MKESDVCTLVRQSGVGGGGGGGGVGSGGALGGGERCGGARQWGGQGDPRERPFCCPLCPHRARRKDSLLRHLRMHTGERPYQCHACPYAAIQKSDLDRHLRARHAPPSLLVAPLSFPPQPYLPAHSPPLPHTPRR